MPPPRHFQHLFLLLAIKHPSIFQCWNTHHQLSLFEDLSFFEFMIDLFLTLVDDQKGSLIFYPADYHSWFKSFFEFLSLYFYWAWKFDFILYRKNLLLNHCLNLSALYCYFKEERNHSNNQKNITTQFLQMLQIQEYFLQRIKVRYHVILSS
jgi:hypothetical protein